MKEDSKNETIELIDVREEIIKDLNVEVARLKQQVMDKEGEMMQMEKIFQTCIHGHRIRGNDWNVYYCYRMYIFTYYQIGRNILKWKNYKELSILNLVI